MLTRFALVWSSLTGLLVCLWLWSAQQGAQGLLQNKTSAAERQLAGLNAKWQALESLSEKIVRALPEQPERNWLEQLAGQASPYFRLTWEKQQRPSWLDSLLAIQPTQSGMFTLCPQPVGKETGRLQGVLPADLPELYWVRGKGRVVLQLDLDYIRNDWLQRQLRDLPAEFQLQEGGRFWGQAPPRRFGDELHPGWNLTTLSGDERYPWAILTVQLDLWPALRVFWMGQSLWLLAGLTGLALVGLAWLQLLRRYRQEKRALLAGQRFQALVSHELRTPISAIQMYAEILRHQWVDDASQLQIYHSIIGEEADRLHHLVENLLSLGRPSGFARKAVDVAALLHGLVSSRGWEVAIEVSQPLPTVLTDPDAVTVIVANLIQNALKYGGPAENVQVKLAAVGPKVSLEVADRGPGIPQADRERVLQPYVRLHPEGPAGLGLGLTLVKNFSDALGARLEIEDRPGGGAIFRLLLPAEEVGS